MSTEVRNDPRAAQDASPLISANELHVLCGKPGVRVFDVRGTWKTPVRALHDDYLAGHIPGAVFLDWTRDFLEQGVAINLAAVASREEAEQSFRSLGVNSGDLIVLYDDYSHMLAGRIWWAMRYWGFDNVRVLNGGWSNWVSQDLPVSTDVPKVEPGSFEPQRKADLRSDIEQFVSERTSACVLDARGAQGFAGKPDDPRTGHIPGAVNVPFSAVLDKETGLFLDRQAVQRVFDRMIPDWRSTKIVSSCGSGYAGTVPMLALWDLGVKSSLYDGSFSEWKQDPSREVEQS